MYDEAGVSLIPGLWLDYEVTWSDDYGEIQEQVNQLA